LSSYFYFYNNARPHQSLGYRTPAEQYYARIETLSEGMVESGKPGIPIRIAGPYLNLE
jgi:hypothetical protein